MIEIAGSAQFFPDEKWGPLPNPTRSFVLGDPSTLGRVVYGCFIELVGQAEIKPGSAGPVRIQMFNDLLPDWPEPWPVWAHLVMGEITGIRRGDAA